MTSDFNWVEDLDQIEEEYFSFQVDFPMRVKCYSLFLDPSYKIDRSTSSTLSLSNGEINQVEMASVAPIKVNAPDGDYRRLLVFSYATSIVDEPKDSTVEWGEVKTISLEEGFVFPKSVRAMHDVNAVYVLYQRSSLRRSGKRNETRRVRFKTQTHKTRRASP
jgi:hypothetical protein